MTLDSNSEISFSFHFRRWTYKNSMNQADDSGDKDSESPKLDASVYLPSSQAKGSDRNEKQEPLEKRVIFHFRSRCFCCRTATPAWPKGHSWRKFYNTGMGQKP